MADVPTEIIKVAHRLQVVRDRVNEPDVKRAAATKALQDLVDAWNLVAALRGWPVIR